MNDYMAAYHDSVLLVGEVMRKIWGELGEGSDMQSINHSYFRNITFNGKNMDNTRNNRLVKFMFCIKTPITLPSPKIT